MNAELLHAIAQALRRDLETTNQTRLLAELRDALKQQLDQPNQAQQQQAVSDALSALRGALAKSEANMFSPGWKEHLSELGVDQLVGERLLERVENIFLRNQITVATAHDEVTSLVAEVAELGEAVTSLITGMDHFGIDKLELETGEFEIGLYVPRAAVHNHLGDLGKELELLQRLLLPFDELATGQRTPFDVKSLSSSEFTVLLQVAAPTAAAFAVAIERLIAAYKNILEIRRLRAMMTEEGVSDDALEAVDEHADKHMEASVEEVVTELLEANDSVTDDGRRNELANELRMALNSLANRIDAGYQVDVRAGQIEMAETEDGEQPADPENAGYAETVQDLAFGLRFLRLEGGPILGLPEPDEMPGLGDDDTNDE